MIIAIRERFLRNRTLVTYSIFGVIALAFVLPGAVRRMTSDGDWIVRVNGRPLSRHDYIRKAQFIDQQIMFIRQQYSQYADMFLNALGLNADPKELAIKALIDEELINQAAQSLALHFHQEYIDAQLDSLAFVQQAMPDLIPGYVFDQQSGSLNEERLCSYLKKNRISAASFQQKVHDALSRLLCMRLLLAGAYTAPSVLLDRYASTYQLKKYGIITIPFDRFLKQEQQKLVSDDAVQSFYQITKEFYRIPEKRSGRSWVFSPEGYGISVTDQEINDYYEERKGQLFVDKPAQVEVRRILFAVNSDQDAPAIAKKAAQIHAYLLQEPSSFAEQAKLHSDDKASANNGGLMKPFAKGVQHPSFERAAFLLQSDGEISGVIRTDKGFEIIQRISKRPVSFKLLDAVAKEIRMKLTKQKFGQSFAYDVEELINARDTQALFDFIASRSKGKAREHTLVAKGEDKLSQALFSLESPGRYTLFVDGDQGILVELTSVQSSSIPDLATVRQQVLANYHEVKAHERVKQSLEQALSAALTQPLPDVATHLGGDYVQTEFIDVSKKEILEGSSLPLLELARVEKTGLMATHETARDGYVIKCLEVQPIDSALFEAKRLQIQKDADQDQENALVGGFVASLYRDATIEINNHQVDE